MKKPEKPLMFIRNDELTQKMIANYWADFNRYQRRKRVIEFVVVVVFIILLAVAGAELW